MKRLRPALLASLLAITAAAPLLHGCAGKDVDENDPNALYKEAEEDIENDHYQIAIDKLRTVKNKFPYSNVAVQAQLRIADVYFLQENYGEAALAYQTFKDLHPKHEKTAYATFRVGKSYFDDAPGNIARDLTPATKALEAYQEFLKDYPSAPEVPEAQRDVSELRRMLANKELYIGDFYFKRDDLGSARGRYEKLIALYPETDAAAQAKKKLDELAKDARAQEKK